MFKSVLNDITPYTPGTSIDAIQQKYNLTDVIKLASNENPLGPAAQLSDVNSNYDVYPDLSHHPLIPALATHLNIDSSQLILGNGSDEILQLVGLACIEPGDEVLTSDCTFSEYKFVAQITGATFVTAPMVDYRYSVKSIINAISDRTKIIFIANPNNPTGTILTHSEIEHIMSHTSKNTLVVLDEAYAEYASHTDYPQSLELIKTFPNLLITRTFSKLYGLAGCRIGYGFSTQSLINNIQKVRQPFNINSIALDLAYASLANTDFVKKSLYINQTGKSFLTNELRAHDFIIPESNANFLFIDTKKTDASSLCHQLAQRGIIIRSMASFGCPTAVRVTIGTEQQNTQFLKEFNLCLKNI